MDLNGYKLAMGCSVPGMAMEYNVPGMGMGYKSPPLPTFHKPPPGNCVPFHPQSMNMPPPYYSGQKILTSRYQNVMFPPSAPLPHLPLVSSSHVLSMHFAPPSPPQLSAVNSIGMYGSTTLPLSPLDQRSSFSKHPWSCAFTTVCKPGFVSSVPSHSHVSSPIPPTQRALRELPHNSYSANRGMTTEAAKSSQSSTAFLQAARNHGIMIEYPLDLVIPHSKSESTFKSFDACLAIPKCDDNKKAKFENRRNTESESAAASMQYIENKIPVAAVGESFKTFDLNQGRCDDNLDMIEVNEFLSYDFDEDDCKGCCCCDDDVECNEEDREITGGRIEINTESAVQKDMEANSVEKYGNGTMEDINMYCFDRKTTNQCEDGNKDDHNVHDFSSNYKIEKQTLDNIAFHNTLKFVQKLETLNTLQVNQHTVSLGMQNDPDEEVIKHLALTIVQKAISQGMLCFKESMNAGVSYKVHDQPTVKNESITMCYDLNIQNLDKYVKDGVTKQHSHGCALKDVVARNKLYSWPLITASNVSNNNLHKENIDNINDVDQANDMKNKGNKNEMEQSSDLKILNKTEEFEKDFFKQKALQHSIKIVNPEKGLEETTKTLKSDLANAEVSKSSANIPCPSDCSLREQKCNITKTHSQAPCLDKLTQSDVCNNVGIESFHLDTLDHFKMKATQKGINIQDPKVSVCNDSALEIRSGKRNLSLGSASIRRNSMDNLGGMNSNLNPLTPEFIPSSKSEKQNSGLGCVSVSTTGTDLGLTMRVDAPAFVPNLFIFPVKIEANTAEFQQKYVKPVKVEANVTKKDFKSVKIEANAAKFQQKDLRLFQRETNVAEIPLKCLKPNKHPTVNFTMPNHISNHSVGTQSSPTCAHIGVATRKVKMKDLSVQTAACDTRDVLVNTIESVDSRNHSRELDKCYKKSVSVGVNVNFVELLCENAVFTDEALMDMLIKKVQDLQLQLVACKKKEVLKTLDEMRQGLVHCSDCLLAAFTDGSQSMILKNIVQEQIDAIEKARSEVEEVTQLAVVKIGSASFVDEIPDLTKYIPATLSSSSMTFTGHLMQTEMEKVIENDNEHKFPEIKLCLVDVGTMTEYSHPKTSHVTRSVSHVTAKTNSPVEQKNEGIESKLSEIKLGMIDVGTMTHYSHPKISQITGSPSHVTAERNSPAVQKNEDVVSDVHIKLSKNEHDQVMSACAANSNQSINKSNIVIHDLEKLESWISCMLRPMSRKEEPEALAKFVVFLLLKVKSVSELKSMCLDKLKIFLQSGTRDFVDKLVEVLDNTSYLEDRLELKAKITTPVNKYPVYCTPALSDFVKPLSRIHLSQTIPKDDITKDDVHEKLVKKSKGLMKLHIDSDEESGSAVPASNSDCKNTVASHITFCYPCNAQEASSLNNITNHENLHKDDTVLSDFTSPKNVNKENKMLIDFTSSRKMHEKDNMLGDFLSPINTNKEDAVLSDFTSLKNVHREDKMLSESITFKALLSEKMMAEYSYTTTDISIEDIKYTEDENEFRKLEKAEDSDQILTECKKKTYEINQVMEVGEVFDNIIDKRNACVSDNDDKQIEFWEQKGHQGQNAAMNSLPENQTLDAVNGVDYNGVPSSGIDIDPVVVYMSPPRKSVSKTLVKDNKKTAVMVITPTKAVIGVAGDQNMGMVSMPNLDPFLYQSVVAQLIQSYPKLASNQELLSIVAAQQSALLQNYMNANLTGLSDQPTGMSGSHGTQNLMCNNSLQGFMGNMDTDMTKLRSPMMPASTMVSMSGNAAYDYALENHSCTNTALVETPNTASEKSTAISTSTTCSSNKRVMEKKFRCDIFEGKRYLSRPPGFRSDITDVPYKDEQEQQKAARNSSTLKHNLSAESCHESTSKISNFVDIGIVNVNSAGEGETLRDLVPGNGTAGCAGDLLYHRLTGNGTAVDAGGKTLSELVSGNVTAVSAGETGNRTANGAVKYLDDCITRNVTASGAGGDTLYHHLTGSDTVSSADENVDNCVTRNVTENAAGKCAFINDSNNNSTASCDSPINLAASSKQITLRKYSQAVQEFLPDFARGHNPEITTNRIIHHFSKTLGDQVLGSIANSATVNFSHKRLFDRLASCDKDAPNPLPQKKIPYNRIGNPDRVIPKIYFLNGKQENDTQNSTNTIYRKQNLSSNQANAENSKSSGMNLTGVQQSLRPACPAQARKITHVQVQSENWEDEANEQALEFYLKKSVLLGTSVLKKQPANPTSPFSISPVKKQGTSDTSMLCDISMPEVAKVTVISSEDTNEDSDGWCQVPLTKNRKARKKLTNSKLSVTSQLNPVPTTNEVKKSNFEQLIGRVLQEFPAASRREAIDAVQRVRKLHGSLTGLGMESIIEKAYVFIQSKPDIKCISMWVERERTCPTCRQHVLLFEDFPKLSK